MSKIFIIVRSYGDYESSRSDPICAADCQSRAQELIEKLEQMQKFNKTTLELLSLFEKEFRESHKWELRYPRRHNEEGIKLLQLSGQGRIKEKDKERLLLLSDQMKKDNEIFLAAQKDWITANYQVPQELQIISSFLPLFKEEIGTYLYLCRQDDDFSFEEMELI